MEFHSCYSKQEQLKETMHPLTMEQRLQLLMDMGKRLEPFPEEWKTNAHLVPGCQSKLYFKASLNQDNCMHYSVHSDALISAGLASLLIAIYNNEPPEATIQCPPMILKELGILASLSPGRSNGVRSLYLKMCQAATQAIALQ